MMVSCPVLNFGLKKGQMSQKLGERAACPLSFGRGEKSDMIVLTPNKMGN